jgi:CheY-like chemotaxis protein
MLLELISKLAGQSLPNSHDPEGARPSWNPRKALVCAPEEKRESLARALAENGYKVFVANDTRQAVERMRENQLDVVVLDARFDPVEQGTIFVTREISILRPAQRRRVFFVLLSPSLRTMDPHAAFLNNVNVIINVNEIDEVPRLIEHRLREYNELYKDFNHVNGVPAL